MGTGTWDKLPNENKPGDDPYAMSYPETAREQIERRRLPHREVSQTLFDSTCRPSKAFEDKVKVNSNHIMEGIEKGYMMATNKNPANLTAHQSSVTKKDPELQTVCFSAQDSL